MAITAVISLMTFQGLGEMIKTREAMEQEAGQLAALQSALATLSRDCEGVVPRPIRDGYGNPRPALIGGEREAGAVEFTRGGVRNPGRRARSTRERIAYRLNDRTLVRDSWPVLDRAADTLPSERVLLTGVDGFQVRFLDRRREWQGSWPPAGEAAGAEDRLPLALEVTLELEGWGTITRLFLLAGEGGRP